MKHSLGTELCCLLGPDGGMGILESRWTPDKNAVTKRLQSKSQTVIDSFFLLVKGHPPAGWANRNSLAIIRSTVTVFGNLTTNIIPSFLLWWKTLLQSRSRKIIENIRTEFKIQIEVRRLPVGDGIWIARHKHLGSEYILDFIVERKNVDDLRCSIRDNRYRDQKLRLLSSSILLPLLLGATLQSQEMAFEISFY
ncbi:hypothetical protein TEA_000819 [Camellia sinensis var. sinensis]|uniref:Crossover junction endonuclease MUS81 n=1 Tax=Camellia sinensis var. sinensis TaxID=542762 RepID=A0A4S4DS29_CAMSN|nr:hypothetical protein TEA_000819 [Camellia sinensis var. sinensis]